MNRTTLLLAATMTIGGMAFAPSVFAADAAAPTANNSQQDKAQETQDITAVRTLIGNSTESAVRDNGFGELVNDFTMSMSNPAEKPGQVNGAATGNQGKEPAAAEMNNSKTEENSATAEQTTKLNEQVAAFNKAFKAKYNEDFAVKDAQTLYGDITAADLNEAQAQPAAAEIKGEAGAKAQNTPPTAENTATPAANAGTASAKNEMQASEWVTLSVPEYQGAPAVSVRLVREGNMFRYATGGQELNQQALATNLTDCLTKLNDDQSHWPADANTAERLVSQHVLGAVQKTQEAAMTGNHTPANEPGHADANNGMK